MVTVQTKNEKGEWRTWDEMACPILARALAGNLVQRYGADSVRVLRGAALYERPRPAVEVSPYEHVRYAGAGKRLPVDAELEAECDSEAAAQ